MSTTAVRACRAVAILFVLSSSQAALAQQTGTISGRVTATDGGILPGVTVEARSDVLPTPRLTVTSANGEFRLPALPPGAYTVKFDIPGMQSVTRKAQVHLAQDTKTDVTMGVSGIEETVEVVAEVSLVDRESATISNALASDQILGLPIGQEYREMQKLIPGVQYTQDATRGPSAGGSGQDNVYQFDGVNVTLPLFGTLSSEPASHDISQITVIRGGSRAVDFDRSGGFLMDSVSKSGSSEFHGQLSYQFQSAGMAAELDSDVQSRYEQDRSWITVGVGGPIIKDKLYFYASYFRPEKTRETRSNLYGELPDYESTRNEGFGKLTFTPTPKLLFNFSYRDSKRVDTGDLLLGNVSATTGSGYESRLKIGTAEASWVISPRSFLTAKYTHFTSDNLGQPDYTANVDVSTAVGTRLDVNSLDTQGRLTVPQPIAGQAAYNAFVQPLIDRYGYTLNGVKTGGGVVGYGSQFDDNDFFRDGGQIGYNITLGSGNLTHDLHVGYQLYWDSEDLIRSSNGWGLMTVPGGRQSFRGTPIFYQATFLQQTTGLAKINSEQRTQGFEINDTIKWNRWTFNVGLLASRDTLYGQGLREDASTLSGYTLAPGNKYEMYDISFGKMLQPRLGVTWSFNGKDTVYASYAKYNPVASSLARAASWDRNNATLTMNAYFDQNGVLFGNDAVAASSGKLFVEDLEPRAIHEYILGGALQLKPTWGIRAYARYREGSHFWEDTNNTARVAFEPPPGVPREPYIPDLAAKIAQIGSGSTYVIAELDGAYTKYWEATVETEWKNANTFVRGSYTWSHYYGNFDQDNSTVENDANVFIGSSNIADGAGRQLWNFKDGDLRGDRPHLLKIYGYRRVPWNGSFGVYAVVQSGQPWETWSFEPYRALTTSTVETNRYAEPAGSHRSDTHAQMDLNYTQNFKVGRRYNFQVLADVFNVFDKQTGYSIEPRKANSLYGQPRLYYDPRRFQLAARFQF